MKIINPKDFYKVLLKTDFNSKCLIKLSNPMGICPICNLYFYSTVGYFCPLCKKQKLTKNHNFLVNYYDLCDTCFACIDLSRGKKIFFNIDDVAYFDNQKEQYFIVKI